MKFRVTASSIIISLLICICCLALIFTLGLAKSGYDKLDELLLGLMSFGDRGITIDVQSMDGTLAKAIALNNIDVSCSGKSVAHLDKAELSIGLFEIIKLGLGWSSPKLNLTVSNAIFYVDDETITLLSKLSSSTTEEKETKFPNIDLNLQLSNASVEVDYNGIKTNVTNLYATAKVELKENKINFEGADLNIPNVLVSLPAQLNAKANDIRLSVDKNLKITASLDDASLDGYGEATEISALVDISKDKISLATYLSTLNVLFEDYDTKIYQTTANVDYYFATQEVDLKATVGQVNAQATQSIQSAQLYNLSVSGVLSNMDIADLDLYIKNACVQYQEYGAVLSGLSANLELSNLKLAVNNIKVLGYLNFDDLSVTGLQAYTLQAFRAQNGEVDFSFSDSNNTNDLDARIKAYISGNSNNVYVKNFSSNIDVSARVMNFSELLNASLSLEGLSCAALPQSTALTALNLTYSSNKELNLTIQTGSQLNGSIVVSLENSSVETKLYLTEFVPYSFTAIYNQLLSKQDFVKEDTNFEGSIVFALKLPKGTLDLSTFNTLKLQSTKDINNYIDSGLFSINLAVRNLELDSKLYSGAVSFESTLDGSLLEVGTLAVSSNGYRLSYSGSVDYNNLIPDGRLSLQKAEDGSELAALDFDLVEGTKSYSFKLTSPILEKTSIYGTLDWQNEEAITANAFIESNYLKAGTIPFYVTVFTNPLDVKVESENFSFDASLEDQSLIKLMGSLKGLEIKASALITLAVDMDITASYDLITGEFDTDIGKFSTWVSDFFGFSFASRVTGEKLSLENLTVTRGEQTYVFDGAIEFEYPSFSKLASIAGEGISGLMKLKDKDGVFFIVGTVLDQQFYLQISANSNLRLELTLLGTYENGFYAYGNLGWGEASGFDFNAQYKNGVFAFYDSSGNLGDLSLKDINFNLDATNMSMLFSFAFENVVQKEIDENSRQSGTISLSAQLESFATSLLSLITGIDYDVSFSLGLKDFSLEDGFNIPDTTVDIFYSKGLFTLTGDLISGTFDTASNYIDLHVDKDFLFGVDLKGYLGSELDLYASNLYLPLPLVQQFTDLLLMGINQATITGDLLIKGDAKNPNMYGMLYCQTFEMWLSYLPQQTLSAKNIAISVQDHSLTIAKTPFTGHSNLDGRFIEADAAVSLDLNSWSIESLEVRTNVYTPVDLWVPLPLGTMDLEIRGDATGLVIYGIRNGKPYLESDTTASNMLIDFDIEDKQAWIYALNNPIDIDLDLTIGNDVEFCYPQKNSAFIDFTLSEGEKVHLTFDAVTKSITTAGSLAFKTGQVYYFQNDFYITEGSLDLSPRKDGTSDSNGLSFNLNLNAKLKDFDSSGNKVEINLILQNATLDNISPRFTSTPSMSENEILSLLGQTILPSSSFGQSVSVASVASLAAAATDAISRLGIIESNSNYSLTATIRDSLGFDIFSLRSNILQNIIIDALPGELAGKTDISLLSKYLDGTSLFAGKYLTSGVFAQMSFRLKSEKNNNKDLGYGHFLSKDLILDMEFSVDWDNSLGTFTIFTKPQELSALNILDTIGFSVTKRMQF